MTNVCRAHLMAALLAICTPIAALAQADESQKGQRPFFVIGASYDARSRATVEGGLLIPLSLGLDADAVLGECGCLSVMAGLGPGGQRLAIGPAYQSYIRLYFSGAWTRSRRFCTHPIPHAARGPTRPTSVPRADSHTGACGWASDSRIQSPGLDRIAMS